MRIVKNADVRKNEIMDAAANLFVQKGYDDTSTNDILDAVGIARGTLYHHFKSKEDIMDGLIARKGEELIAAAQKAAGDKSLSIPERLTRTILSLNVGGQEDGSKAMVEHLHKPQNALMHQKTNQIIMQQIPPILASIVEDGVTEGIFKTSYPLECMELAFIYIETISDGETFRLTPEQQAARMQVFILHLEKLLGAEQGQLNFLLKLFGSEANECAF